MKNKFNKKSLNEEVDNQLLIGRYERELRELLQCSILDLEELSGIGDRTIMNIEHKCCCMSTTLAQSFEYYPEAFGYKFNLSDFLKLVIQAIAKGRSVKIEQTEYPTAKGSIPCECFLLLPDPNYSRQDKWHSPYQMEEEKPLLCKAAAIEHCKIIGQFEEDLRWLSGLTREELSIKVNLARNTIREIEKQCHSRCANLFKLLDFYSQLLDFRFSLRLLLDELLEAVERRTSLRVSIVDQSAFTTSEICTRKYKLILHTTIMDREKLKQISTKRINNYRKFEDKERKMQTN